MSEIYLGNIMGATGPQGPPAEPFPSTRFYSGTPDYNWTYWNLGALPITGNAGFVSARITGNGWTQVPAIVLRVFDFHVVAARHSATYAPAIAVYGVGINGTAGGNNASVAGCFGINMATLELWLGFNNYGVARIFDTGGTNLAGSNMSFPKDTTVSQSTPPASVTWYSV